MALNPKRMIELEAVNLIKHLTDFEEDEENFEICERFVLSNLLYHKYLDPDERKINQTIQGVKEKFLVHAQFEKARHFEQLIQKFNDSQVFKERLEQHDLNYRLLSLLLNLAENPVNTEYFPREISEEPEEESIDWLAILREGEESPKHFLSDSDLSEWSDSDSEDVSRHSRHSAKSGSGNTVASTSRRDTSGNTDDELRTWFDQHVQFPYWDSEQDEQKLGTNRFSRRVEMRLEARGRINVKTEKLTEYQLIREILWMLRAPTDSPVFELRNGEFHVTDQVALLSATDEALKSLLGEVVPVLGYIHSFHTFIHHISTSRPGSVPHTVEAYTSGLNHALHQFSRFLLEVELDVSSQETTFTTIMILDRLRIWFRKIKGLVSVHGLATEDYFEFGEEENCYKSMRILSVLYNSVISAIYPDLIDLLMDIFLMSLKPFLTILDTWLVHGTLVDSRKEFIYYKDTSALAGDHENIWSNVFKEREYLNRLVQNKIQPIALFVKLIKKILVAGKSNEILYKMDRLSFSSGNESLNTSTSSTGAVTAFSQTIYSEFIESIRSRIPKFSCGNQGPGGQSPAKRKLQLEVEQAQAGDCFLPEEQQLASKLGQDHDDILQLAADDEFLLTAFSSLIKDIDQQHQEPQMSRCEELGIKLDPMIPLENILSDSLAGGIIKHYNRSSKALLHLILKDLKLEKELSKARLVYFMEAGDLMQDFNYQIFSIIHRKDTDLLDGSSLTLLLQDHLSQRFEGWTDQFTCNYLVTQEDKNSPVLSLRGLTINMEISWPLNIIISEDNLKMYNKVFLFLVTLKHSLWCLQSISLAEIAQLDKEIQKDESLSEELSGSSRSTFDQSSSRSAAAAASRKMKLENSAASAGIKQHRLQLLRAWLIYFVTLLHGYFMSRVVHSTQLELREGISRATDLDMLIQVHQLYLTKIHDTCFLHPEVKMLKEAINMILGICIEFHTCVVEKSIHSAAISSWEDKYARCHNFLSTMLNEMIRKKKLPHLEGLAAALLHSCPQQQ